MQITLSVIFLCISFWFFSLTFGSKKITNSAFFLLIILLVLWIQAFISPSVYGLEVSVSSWKSWLGFVATLLYLGILPITWNEFFIMGVQEEDFYCLLESCLAEMNIPYKLKENSSIPVSDSNTPMKWFFIFGSRTGFIRCKTRKLYRKCQDYINQKKDTVRHSRVSFEKIVFAVVGCLFLGYSIISLISL